MKHLLEKSNTWQKQMYSNFFAQVQLDSKFSHQKARKEVQFLISILGLNTKKNILDIPCGTGRHALAFGQKGYSVVGVDINDVCLEKAKASCKGMKNVQIKKGNMAKLSYGRKKFDVLINMFSSFGYFKTEDENEKVLKGLIRTLKPGGTIVVQTINREYILKVFKSFSWEEDSEMYFVSKREYNKRTKYLETHQLYLFKKAQSWEKSCHRMRLYSISEMKTLLQKSGLKKIRVFEGCTGRSAQRYFSSHPIYIAQVPDKR